jgi:hypothetical protein
MHIFQYDALVRERHVEDLEDDSKSPVEGRDNVKTQSPQASSDISQFEYTLEGTRMGA